MLQNEPLFGVLMGMRYMHEGMPSRLHCCPRSASSYDWTASVNGIWVVRWVTDCSGAIVDVGIGGNHTRLAFQPSPEGCGYMRPLVIHALSVSVRVPYGLRKVAAAVFRAIEMVRDRSA